jgi:oligopeptide/dipeptide ABC transporter ATP-binding protein
MADDNRRVGEPLLELKGLKTYLFTSRGIVKAVDGVSLTVAAGERVGLVGESGCGKSMTARSILRLVPEPPARIVDGQILYRNRDLTRLSESEMQKIRGAEIAMVFQDPMSYLNPTMRIGDQIGEAVWLHYGNEGLEKAVDEAIALVGLSTRAGIARRYPHELSGGMRQRVLLAMALACRPALLIADEPTTALDVTIQAQILSLLSDLTDRLDMALLLITHDLGIVAELCDRVYVMYAGQIVEEAQTVALFETPAHPYTQGLLAGVLSIDEFKPVLKTIPGTVPDLSALPSGCRFRARCPHAMPICEQEPPVFRNASGQVTRCWLYDRTVRGPDGDWEEIADNAW